MSRPLPPDDQLRALHAHAVASLAPATLARLRTGRHAARATRGRRPALWLAGTCAGVMALAAGISLQHGQAPAPAIAPMVAVLEDGNGALDEHPELYLWLGNHDLAME